jgi:hypothetical protein
LQSAVIHADDTKIKMLDVGICREAKSAARGQTLFSGVWILQAHLYVGLKGLRVRKSLGGATN